MIRRPPRSTLFPSRRSSDLQPRSDRLVAPGRRRGTGDDLVGVAVPGVGARGHIRLVAAALLGIGGPFPGDRKSTRLNSSHVEISYAVFCLKKKKEHGGAADR